MKLVAESKNEDVVVLSFMEPVSVAMSASQTHTDPYRVSELANSTTMESAMKSKTTSKQANDNTSIKSTRQQKEANDSAVQNTSTRETIPTRLLDKSTRYRHPCNGKNCSDAIVFFDTDNSDKSPKKCWLSFNNNDDDVQLLGCGHDGHFFNVTMYCDNGDSRRHVGLKVLTQLTPAPTYQYTSETKSSIETLKRIHDTLLSNTTQAMKRHFLVQVGTVQFYEHFLYHSLDRSKCHILKKFPFSKRNNNHAVVIGTIVELFQGTIWNPKHMTRLDQRSFARDLVRIFHHMFQRNFLHQDMRGGHFSYDPTTTTTSLFDFQRHLTLAKANQVDRRSWHSLQQVQLYQLLILLGNVCLNNREAMEVPPLATVRRRLDFDNQDFLNWTLAMERCNFKNSQQEQHSPIQKLRLLGLNISTARAYQLLSEWTDDVDE